MATKLANLSQRTKRMKIPKIVWGGKYLIIRYMRIGVGCKKFPSHSGWFISVFY